MSDNGGEIGKAYISVDADLRPFEASMATVKAKTAAAVAEASAVANAAATGAYALDGGGSGAYSIAGQAQAEEAGRVAKELQESYARAFGGISNDADAAFKKVEESAKNAWQGTAASGKVAAATIDESFKRSVASVTQFIAKVAAIGGIAATFYKIGEAIRESFEDRLEKAADSAERFKQAIDFGDSAGSLASVDKQIADVQSRLAGRGEQNFLAKAIGFVRGESVAAFEAEAASLEQTRQFLQSKQDAEQAARESKELQQAREAAERKAKAQQEVERRLADQYKDVMAEGLNAPDRVNLDYDRRVGEVQRGLSDATKVEREIRIALINELEKARMRSIEKLKEEEIKANRDAAQNALAEQMRFAEQVGRATKAALQEAFTISDSTLERIEVGINRLIEVVQIRDGGGL